MGPMRTEPTLADAFDLAGLQGDGAARASDDGRRRVLACAPLPAAATPQVCVAAWHGVLHWLHSAVALLERPDAQLAAQRCPATNGTPGLSPSVLVGPEAPIRGDLARRLAGWVAKSPDKPAVVDERGSITFAELDARSTAWAW